MSFIDVEDGQFDEVSFNAQLKFAQGTSDLKFDKVNTALTHILYRYELDENGNIAYTYDAGGNKVLTKTKISSDFFDVIYDESGVIKIRAFKNLGGGLFKFVLVTKDSYLLEDDPNSITVLEDYFETTYSFTVRVSDGEIGSDFLISTNEDLLLINKNLDKHFKLAANIGVEEIVNIKPIGLVGSSVNEFTGKFSGEFETLVGEGETKTTSYSITLKIQQTVESSEYGILAGLFAVLGESAQIKNVKLNVEICSSFECADINGIKIGSIASVNKGLIDNVEVVITNNETNFDLVTAGITDFGGIVGLNETEGSIIGAKVDNSNALVLSMTNSKQYNIGLIAGTNNGLIKGNYLGKDSLNDFEYDIYSNLTITNKSINDYATFFVGSAVGVNNNVVEGLLVGGQIKFNVVENNKENGFVGGIVGKSEGTTNIVRLTTAMALEIDASKVELPIGGIVGLANETEIDTVKFVSVQVMINEITTKGQLVGGIVGGVVAEATNASINYASIESFIQKVVDETKSPSDSDYITIFNTLEGSVVAGLVSTISGTTVENSFVHANLSSSDKMILTSEADETNTYFIGKINRNFILGEDVNKTTYCVIDGHVFKTGMSEKTLVWSSIMIEDYSIDDKTADWNGVYVSVGENLFKKVDAYDSSIDSY